MRQSNSKEFHTSNLFSNIMRWGCYFTYSLFSFFYLYFFQGGVMAAFQHVLSEGVTSYDNLIGAILITIFLLVLQLGIAKITNFGNKLFALTFLPSFIILALLTNVNSSISNIYEFQSYLWLPIILLILCGILSAKSNRLMPMISLRNNSILSQELWLNLMLMVFMMLMTGFTGNDNEIFHYRMKIEQNLQDGNHTIENYLNYYTSDNADSVAKQNSSSITMLYAHSLTKENAMGNRLFKSTILCEGKDLLPLSKSNSACVVYPTDSVFKYLGAKPIVAMTTNEYLCIIDKMYPNNKKIGDYILCGALIDRNLDKFVKQLPNYYSQNDSLPLHYKEALMLYNKNKSEPLFIINDEKMLTDYAEMNNIENEFPDYNTRKLKVWEKFKNTYWWYYQYCR